MRISYWLLNMSKLCAITINYARHETTTSTQQPYNTTQANKQPNISIIRNSDKHGKQKPVVLVSRMPQHVRLRWAPVNPEMPVVCPLWTIKDLLQMLYLEKSRKSSCKSLLFLNKSCLPNGIKAKSTLNPGLSGKPSTTVDPNRTRIFARNWSMQVCPQYFGRGKLMQVWLLMQETQETIQD